MLPYLRNDKDNVKIRVAQNSIEKHIDLSQPPLKPAPFSSIWAQQYSHTLDVMLPAELLDMVQSHLEDDAKKWRFAKVTMSLLEVLSGDFFDAYFKHGSVSMLSEGVRGSDEIFEAHEGFLRLTIDRSTYEKCGLQGRPVPDGGRKHTKSRFLIEHDLRVPAAVKGKKGFDRLLAAAQDVLNSRKTWLFFEHSSDTGKTAVQEPIAAFYPKWVHLTPEISSISQVSIPQWPSSSIAGDAEFAADVHEWLALLALGSPRVKQDDTVDPYLCRYSVPLFDPREEARPRISDVVHLRYRGFIPSAFFLKVFVTTRRAVLRVAANSNGTGVGANSGLNAVENAWAGLTAHGFQDDHLTLLLPNTGCEVVEFVHQRRL